MTQKRNIAIILLGISVIVFVIGIVVFFKQGKGESETAVDGLRVAPLVGSTVEERLEARNVNLEGAIITKIEDASVLQSRYSGLFKDAKNGQYLVELSDKVIIYDFEHDNIISEFNFQRIDLGELRQ